MIEINVTVLVQCVNFAIALYMLNVLLIRPVRNVLQQRRDKVQNLESSVLSFTTLAEERLANYEAILEKARAEALEARLLLRQKALGAAEDIVHDAEQAAHTSLEDTHKRIGQEIQDAQRTLQQDMNGFVDLVIKKIL